MGSQAASTAPPKENTPAEVQSPQSKAPVGVYQPLYSEEFYLYSFKIVPCTKAYPHNWSTCPFLHRGEKARRRDPRIHAYQALPCPYDKKGSSCPFGDTCQYTHNVYEYWLHPARFRVQVCKDKQHCNRPLCFFAHTIQELRVPVTDTIQQLQQQQQGYGDNSSSSNTNSLPLQLLPAAAAPAPAAAATGGEGAAAPAASASMGEVLQTLQDVRWRHAATAAAAGSSAQEGRVTYVPLLQPCTPPAASQAQPMMYGQPGVQVFSSSGFGCMSFDQGFMSSDSGIMSSQGMLSARAAAQEQAFQQQALLVQQQQQQQAINMQQQQLAATMQQQQEQQMMLMLMQQQLQWIEQQQWVDQQQWAVQQHPALDSISRGENFAPGALAVAVNFPVNSGSVSGSLSSHSVAALATPGNSSGRFCVVPGSSLLPAAAAAAAAGTGNTGTTASGSSNSASNSASGSGAGSAVNTSAGHTGTSHSSSGAGGPRFAAAQSPRRPQLAATPGNAGGSSNRSAGAGSSPLALQQQQGASGRDGDAGGLVRQLVGMQLSGSQLLDL